MASRALARWIALVIATACTPTHRAPEASEREPAPSVAEPTSSKIDPNVFDGRKFVSVSIEGYTLLPETPLRLRFGDDASFGAWAGCNWLKSPVVGVSTGVLDVYRPMQTSKYCAGARDEQDRWLIGFVASKPAWSLEGRRLTLRNDEVEVVMMEEPRATP